MFNGKVQDKDKKAATQTCCLTGETTRRRRVSTAKFAKMIVFHAWKTRMRKAEKITRRIFMEKRH